MKLVTLNTWGGRAGKAGLLQFFEKLRDDIDIFCLQEIWSGPYTELESRLAGGKPMNHDGIQVYGKQEISKVLSEYEYIFHPSLLEDYGLMILVKKGVELKDSGEIFVHRYKGFVPEGDLGHHARNIQFVSFELNGRDVTVINFHGLWNGLGKDDSEDRIRQSEKILEFIGDLRGDIVLCGDFNLKPGTKSLQMFEEGDMKNLISEYQITSTRTSLYTKAERFADYMFVSEGILVKDFCVMPDEVSDHSPLMLEFE